MILFINACVRKDSRTKKLAEVLLSKLEGDVVETDLGKIRFPIADEEFISRRDELEKKCCWDDPMFDLAKQFASADQVVIAAPYWDLSFPAALKQYFEQINVLGITFEYSPQGTPIPLCKASRLYYVTTAGGAFVPEEFGFGYVKALSQGFYGINDVRHVRAVGLDIEGADIDAIMDKAVESCNNMHV